MQPSDASPTMQLAHFAKMLVSDQTALNTSLNILRERDILQQPSKNEVGRSGAERGMLEGLRVAATVQPYPAAVRPTQSTISSSPSSSRCHPIARARACKVRRQYLRHDSFRRSLGEGFDMSHLEDTWPLPKYNPGSAKHLHALGVIAITYASLERNIDRLYADRARNQRCRMS
jgi:hypothetical protein